MKYSWILLVVLSTFNLFAQDIEIRGTVFNDKNGNSIKNQGELGVPNVVVSDQLNTFITDKNGDFILTSSTDFPYIFITQPTGYVGKYYYPKAPIVKIPIQKDKDQAHFKFIHASDTHIDSLNIPRMNRFREMADSIGADFIVISGDLIRDALRVKVATASNYYEMYLKEIEKFKMPVYSAVGNHEIFGIERDKSLVSSDHPLYGKKMFRHYLGPNYYSFNYGGFHFIALDGVDYQNLYYFGGVDSLQLQWLENDLKYIPSDIPIITFNHIPFVSPGFSFQNFENDPFYGPQLLIQDKTHQHRHIVYNFAEVKTRIGNRPYPLALSGHYHAAQEGLLKDSNTLFAQTSAISRPDEFDYYGFKVRSGFTLYEMKEGKIISSKFIPLNFE